MRVAAFVILCCTLQYITSEIIDDKVHNMFNDKNKYETKDETTSDEFEMDQFGKVFEKLTTHKEFLLKNGCSSDVGEGDVEKIEIVIVNDGQGNERIFEEDTTIKKVPGTTAKGNVGIPVTSISSSSASAAIQTPQSNSSVGTGSAASASTAANGNAGSGGIATEAGTRGAGSGKSAAVAAANNNGRAYGNSYGLTSIDEPNSQGSYNFIQNIYPLSSSSSSTAATGSQDPEKIIIENINGPGYKPSGGVDGKNQNWLLSDFDGIDYYGGEYNAGSTDIQSFIDSNNGGVASTSSAASAASGPGSASSAASTAGTEGQASGATSTTSSSGPRSGAGGLGRISDKQGSPEGLEEGGPYENALGRGGIYGPGPDSYGEYYRVLSSAAASAASGPGSASSAASTAGTQGQASGATSTTPSSGPRSGAGGLGRISDKQGSPEGLEEGGPYENALGRGGIYGPGPGSYGKYYPVLSTAAASAASGPGSASSAAITAGTQGPASGATSTTPSSGPRSGAGGLGRISDKQGLSEGLEEGGPYENALRRGGFYGPGPGSSVSPGVSSTKKEDKTGKRRPESEPVSKQASTAPGKRPAMLDFYGSGSHGEYYQVLSSAAASAASGPGSASSAASTAGTQGQASGATSTTSSSGPRSGAGGLGRISDKQGSPEGLEEGGPYENALGRGGFYGPGPGSSVSPGVSSTKKEDKTGKRRPESEPVSKQASTAPGKRPAMLDFYGSGSQGEYYQVLSSAAASAASGPGSASSAASTAGTQGQASGATSTTSSSGPRSGAGGLGRISDKQGSPEGLEEGGPYENALGRGGIYGPGPDSYGEYYRVLSSAAASAASGPGSASSAASTAGTQGQASGATSTTPSSGPRSGAGGLGRISDKQGSPEGLEEGGPYENALGRGGIYGPGPGSYGEYYRVLSSAAASAASGPGSASSAAITAGTQGPASGATSTTPSSGPRSGAGGLGRISDKQGLSEGLEEGGPYENALRRGGFYGPGPGSSVSPGVSSTKKEDKTGKRRPESEPVSKQASTAPGKRPAMLDFYGSGSHGEYYQVLSSAAASAASGPGSASSAASTAGTQGQASGATSTTSSSGPRSGAGGLGRISDKQGSPEGLEEGGPYENALGRGGIYGPGPGSYGEYYRVLSSAAASAASGPGSASSAASTAGTQGPASGATSTTSSSGPRSGAGGLGRISDKQGSPEGLEEGGPYENALGRGGIYGPGPDSYGEYYRVLSSAAASAVSGPGSASSAASTAGTQGQASGATSTTPSSGPRSGAGGLGRISDKQGSPEGLEEGGPYENALGRGGIYGPGPGSYGEYYRVLSSAAASAASGPGSASSAAITAGTQGPASGATSTTPSSGPRSGAGGLGRISDKQGLSEGLEEGGPYENALRRGGFYGPGPGSSVSPGVSSTKKEDKTGKRRPESEPVSKQASTAPGKRPAMLDFYGSGSHGEYYQVLSSAAASAASGPGSASSAASTAGTQGQASGATSTTSSSGPRSGAGGLGRISDKQGSPEGLEEGGPYENALGRGGIYGPGPGSYGEYYPVLSSAAASAASGPGSASSAASTAGIQGPASGATSTTSSSGPRSGAGGLGRISDKQGSLEGLEEGGPYENALGRGGFYGPGPGSSVSPGVSSTKKEDKTGKRRPESEPVSKQASTAPGKRPAMLDFYGSGSHGEYYQVLSSAAASAASGPGSASSAASTAGTQGQASGATSTTSSSGPRSGAGGLGRISDKQGSPEGLEEGGPYENALGRGGIYGPGPGSYGEYYRVLSSAAASAASGPGSASSAASTAGTQGQASGATSTTPSSGPRSGAGGLGRISDKQGSPEGLEEGGPYENALGRGGIYGPGPGSYGEYYRVLSSAAASAASGPGSASSAASTAGTQGPASGATSTTSSSGPRSGAGGLGRTSDKQGSPEGLEEGGPYENALGRGGIYGPGPGSYGKYYPVLSSAAASAASGPGSASSAAITAGTQGPASGATSTTPSSGPRSGAGGLGRISDKQGLSEGLEEGGPYENALRRGGFYGPGPGSSVSPGVSSTKKEDKTGKRRPESEPVSKQASTAPGKRPAMLDFYGSGSHGEYYQVLSSAAASAASGPGSASSAASTAGTQGQASGATSTTSSSGPRSGAGGLGRISDKQGSPEGLEEGGPYENAFGRGGIYGPGPGSYGKYYPVLSSAAASAASGPGSASSAASTAGTQGQASGATSTTSSSGPRSGAGGLGRISDKQGSPEGLEEGGPYENALGRGGIYGPGPGSYGEYYRVLSSAAASAASGPGSASSAASTAGTQGQASGATSTTSSSGPRSGAGGLGRISDKQGSPEGLEEGGPYENAFGRGGIYGPGPGSYGKYYPVLSSAAASAASGPGSASSAASTAGTQGQASGATSTTSSSGPRSGAGGLGRISDKQGSPEGLEEGGPYENALGRGGIYGPGPGSYGEYYRVLSSAAASAASGPGSASSAASTAGTQGPASGATSTTSSSGPRSGAGGLGRISDKQGSPEGLEEGGPYENALGRGGIYGPGPGSYGEYYRVLSSAAASAASGPGSASSAASTAGTQGQASGATSTTSSSGPRSGAGGLGRISDKQGSPEGLEEGGPYENALGRGGIYGPGPGSYGEYYTVLSSAAASAASGPGSASSAASTAGTQGPASGATSTTSSSGPSSGAGGLGSIFDIQGSSERLQEGGPYKNALGRGGIYGPEPGSSVSPGVSSTKKGDSTGTQRPTVLDVYEPGYYGQNYSAPEELPTINDNKCDSESSSSPAISAPAGESAAGIPDAAPTTSGVASSITFVQGRKRVRQACRLMSSQFILRLGRKGQPYAFCY